MSDLRDRLRRAVARREPAHIWNEWVAVKDGCMIAHDPTARGIVAKLRAMGASASGARATYVRGVPHAVVD